MLLLQKDLNFLTFYLSFLLDVRVSDEHLSGEWCPLTGRSFLGRRTFGQNPQFWHLYSELNTICDGHRTVGNITTTIELLSSNEIYQRTV